MKSIPLLTLVFALGMTLNSRAHALLGGNHHFYLGAGALFYNVGKTTTSNDASTSMLGQMYLPLTLTLKLPLTYRLNLQPNVSYTPLSVTAADSVSKKILTTGLNLGIETSPIIDLKAGLGILNYSITGDGSTVTRSNGGSTATFYLPNSTQTSKSIYVDVGITMDLPFGTRLDADAIVLNSFTTSRAFSTLVTLSKGFL